MVRNIIPADLSNAKLSNEKSLNNMELTKIQKLI